MSLYHVIVSHAPPDDDDQRQHQQRNLHTRSHRDSDRQVHFVLAGHRHGRGVLGRITHDRQQNQTDKGLGDAASFGDGVDGIDLPALVSLVLKDQVKGKRRMDKP